MDQINEQCLKKVDHPKSKKNQFQIFEYHKILPVERVAFAQPKVTNLRRIGQVPTVHGEHWQNFEHKE
jgi:hypothetical protein